MLKTIATFKYEGTNFEVGIHEDGEVVFLAKTTYNDPWTWREEEEVSYEPIAACKNPLTVMRRLAKEVLTFVKKTKTPYFYFTANTETKHRIYMTFLNKVMKELPEYGLQENEGLVYLLKLV